MEKEEVIQRVEALLKNQGRLDCDFDDPQIKELLPKLKNAGIRLALSQMGIMINIDLKSKTEDALYNFLQVVSVLAKAESL